MGVVTAVDLAADLGEELVLLALGQAALGRLLLGGLFETLVRDPRLVLGPQWVLLGSRVERGVVLGSRRDGPVAAPAAARSSRVVASGSLGLGGQEEEAGFTILIV